MELWVAGQSDVYTLEAKTKKAKEDFAAELREAQKGFVKTIFLNNFFRFMFLLTSNYTFKQQQRFVLMRKKCLNFLKPGVLTNWLT
jgi:hypothetical protein